MVSFVGQKLVSLIRSYLFIFAFISIFVGDCLMLFFLHHLTMWPWAIQLPALGLCLLYCESVNLCSGSCGVPPQTTFRTEAFSTPSGRECLLVADGPWLSSSWRIALKDNYLIPVSAHPSLGVGLCRGSKYREANLGHLWRAIPASELSHGISWILCFIVIQLLVCPVSFPSSPYRCSWEHSPRIWGYKFPFQNIFPGNMTNGNLGDFSLVSLSSELFGLLYCA